MLANIDKPHIGNHLWILLLLMQSLKSPLSFKFFYTSDQLLSLQGGNDFNLLDHFKQIQPLSVCRCTVQVAHICVARGNGIPCRFVLWGTVFQTKYCCSLKVKIFSPKIVDWQRHCCRSQRFGIDWWSPLSRRHTRFSTCRLFSGITWPRLLTVVRRVFRPTLQSRRHVVRWFVHVRSLRIVSITFPSNRCGLDSLCRSFCCFSWEAACTEAL